MVSVIMIFIAPFLSITFFTKKRFPGVDAGNRFLSPLIYLGLRFQANFYPSNGKKWLIYLLFMSLLTLLFNYTTINIVLSSLPRDEIIKPQHSGECGAVGRAR